LHQEEFERCLKPYLPKGISKFEMKFEGDDLTTGEQKYFIEKLRT
jgi:hypothetical protein